MIFAIEIPERARSGSGPYESVHTFMLRPLRHAVPGSDGAGSGISED